MRPPRIANAAAVILAGGRSSRLFPFNKVLSDLTGTGRTLVQQTQDRLKAFPKNGIYVLTTRDMAASVGRQLQLPESHIFVDPVRRGTWPALLWAMAHLRRTSPETVLAVLPGDHIIRNDSAYKEVLSQAIEMARAKPTMVLLGITPTDDPAAWRGLGCFRTDTQGRITQFQEKPSEDEIERMRAEGGWNWNAGMFFFRISVAERALERHQPEMHRIYSELIGWLAKGKAANAASLFGQFPDRITHPMDPARKVDNSIDFAILTPLVARAGSGIEARAIADVPFQWTDLGQWSALKGVVRADIRGNVCIGDVKAGPEVRESILVADRGHRIEITRGDALVVALAGQKALVVPVAKIGRVKEMVAASKGEAAIVGEKADIAFFALGKRGNVVILSNKPKEAL